MKSIVITFALLLPTTVAMSLTPPPPQPGDELLPLIYEQFDGDNWHRSDGWLDPEVHWCDWYGVTCGDEFWPGLFQFDALELPANNLSGEMSEELAWLLFRWVAPRNRLDLRRNAISGALDHFPAATRHVDLSDNQLSGVLPEVTSPVVHTNDKQLLAARNRLDGRVPDSWQVLRLRELDLANNRLADGHLNAFLAMSRDSTGFLDLAGNEFNAELTVDIQAARLNRNDSGNSGGGLRLCFNDFTLASESVRQWVAERHAGGPGFEQCLGGERADMDASVSGSWFNPDFDGEGVSLQLLDTGAPLLYSFSYDRQGRQQWLFEVGLPAPRAFVWQPLIETRGDFAQGIRFDGDHPLMRGATRMRIDRIETNLVHLERTYWDLTACGPLESADPNRPPGPGLCPPPLFSDRLDFVRLTELAGTTCDNAAPGQEYSGAWYDPERNGEGFVIEILPDGRGQVYWFTYAADGSGEQAWMTGVGELSFPATGLPAPRAHLVIESLLMPVGATYGPDFDPADVERLDWGRLEIGFFQDGSAEVHWDSHFDEFGSGSYPIKRLARPMLAECESVEGNT
jgi:hypothetical protein